MKALCIDPSSRCTGYAVITETGKILDAGLLQPNKLKDPLWFRIDAMTADLRLLIAEIKPDYLVIEVPTATHRRMASRATRLVLYGCAVGALYEAGRSTGVKVVTVAANKWTKGKPKRDRVDMIIRKVARYRPDQDSPGRDMADALGLALWFQAEWIVAVHRQAKIKDCH